MPDGNESARAPTTLFSLPSEMLLEVFTNLIQDPDSQSISEPIVLILCSVCKFFRELLLASPTVWAALRLRTFPDLNGAPLFIERSKTCPLNLSVYFDVFDFIAPVVVQSFDVPRWHTLTVRSPFSSDITRFLQAISNIPTPELEDVQLLAREQSDCGDEHVPLLSNASDVLRTLTMRGCIRCLAPFPNLTRLNISGLLCNYEEFRNLIQGSPNLTTLILGHLRDHLDPEPDMGARPLFEAPSLKFLAVGFVNADLISGDRPILASLCTPNLEYLEVVGSRAEYGELKPLGTLRTLCLRDMTFPICDGTIYRSFSKITRLELNNVQGVESLAAPEENGATPWPELRTIVCRFPEEESPSWLDSLLDRRPRLTLYVPEHHKELDDLRAIGVSHDVRFLPSNQPSGLIRAEDFAWVEWVEGDSDEEFSGSDFDEEQYWDEIDAFEDHGWEPEFDQYEDEYEDEDDDGLDGVEDWF